MNGLKKPSAARICQLHLNFFALLNLGLVLTAVGIVYFKIQPLCPAAPSWPIYSAGRPVLDQRGRLYVHHQHRASGATLSSLGVMHGLDDLLPAFAFRVRLRVAVPPASPERRCHMPDLVFAVFLPALGAAIV